MLSNDRSKTLNQTQTTEQAYGAQSSRESMDSDVYNTKQENTIE